MVGVITNGDVFTAVVTTSIAVLGVLAHVVYRTGRIHQKVRDMDKRIKSLEQTRSMNRSHRRLF